MVQGLSAGSLHCLLAVAASALALLLWDVFQQHCALPLAGLVHRSCRRSSSALTRPLCKE